LYQSNLNPTKHAEKGSPLTRAFSSMLNSVWNGAETSYGVAPRELKQVIGSLRKAYSGYDQLDSREFM
jgi:ubiquitin C-terminal hydrolase